MKHMAIKLYWFFNDLANCYPGLRRCYNSFTYLVCPKKKKSKENSYRFHLLAFSLLKLLKWNCSPAIFTVFTPQSYTRSPHSMTTCSVTEVTMALNKEIYRQSSELWPLQPTLQSQLQFGHYGGCSFLWSHDHYLKPSLPASNKKIKWRSWEKEIVT